MWDRFMLPGIEGMADSTARKRRIPHLNANPKLELCLSELPHRLKGLGSMSTGMLGLGSGGIWG